MEKMQVKMDKKSVLLWAITLGISGLVATIPVTETFTQPIKIFCIITAFCILLLAFELINTTIIVLMIPLLFQLTQLAPLSAILSPWTQTTVWMMLGGILIGNVFERTGILDRISYYFIIKMKGSFQGILYALVISGCVLAYIMPGGAMVLYFVLVYGIMAVVWIIGFLLNFLLTPLAAAAVLGGPITAAIIELGYWPEPILYSMLQAFDNALLPYEAAGFVLLYSFGMVTMAQFVKMFAIKTVVSFLYTVLIATTFWLIIGLFEGPGFLPFFGF